MASQHQKQLAAFGNKFLCLFGIATLIVVGWHSGRSSAQEAHLDAEVFLKGRVVSASARIANQWVEIRLAHTVIGDSRVSYLMSGTGDNQQVIQLISGTPITSTRSWAMALDENYRGGVVCEYFQRPDSCDIRLIQFDLTKNIYRGDNPEGFIRDLIQKGTPEEIGQRMLDLEAKLEESRLVATNFKIKDEAGKPQPLIALSSTDVNMVAQQETLTITIKYDFLRGKKSRIYTVAYDRSDNEWIRTQAFEPASE